MNLHKKAHTTLHSRLLMVRRMLKHERSATGGAADFGVGERTVCKRLARRQHTSFRRPARAHVAGWSSRMSAARSAASASPRGRAKQIALLRAGTNGLSRGWHSALTSRRGWWLTQSIGQSATVHFQPTRSISLTASGLFSPSFAAFTASVLISPHCSSTGSSLTPSTTGNS